MNFAMVVSACLAATYPPADALRASARLAGGEVGPGGRYRVILDVEVGDGYAASDSGLPAPLLQIQTPPSVRLPSEPAATLAELSKSGMLNQPYELLLTKNPLAFDCLVVSPPSADDAIHLNVIAYLRGESPQDVHLIRRRLALPVKRDATSVEVKPTSSEWGERDVLQIGDQASPLELPRADGTTYRLAEHLGRKNVVVTTYRAHW